MPHEQNNKLSAFGKMLWGGVRFSSGVALAFGHGISAIVLKTPASRMPVAKMQIEAGEKTFKQGWQEWNACP